jgi:hypothetical protein
MDQSTPIVEWELLRPWFDRGYDIVIGSRAAFREIRRALILREFVDTQCGFKACRREAAMQCFPMLEFFHKSRNPAGWTVSAYDVELLYLWQREGYSIKEVTVRWWNRDMSQTKGSVGGGRQYIQESRNMLREIMRVRSNVVRGVYDRK